MKSVYMDHASATPVRKEVTDAMRPYFEEHFANPSTVYDMGSKIKETLEEQRSKVAQLIGAKAGEIIFANRIEDIVNSHPNILESAAFGIPSEETFYEEIKLCVVLKKRSNFSHEDLYNFIVQSMAFYMVPRYIEFKQQLPRSGNLQIQKFLLKNEWERTKRNTWDAHIKDLIQLKKEDNKLEVFD